MQTSQEFCYRLNSAVVLFTGEPMKRIKNLALAAIVGLLALNTLASTLEINGVKVDDSSTVNNVKLELNGAGTRYKGGIFKVYVAGLYLGKKTGTPDEVVNQPGPKRLSITMVRDIVPLSWAS